MVAAAFDKEQVTGRVSRRTRAGVGTQPQGCPIGRVALRGLEQNGHPAWAEHLSSLIAAVADQELGYPHPVTLACEKSSIDMRGASTSIEPQPGISRTDPTPEHFRNIVRIPFLRRAF